ncbi:MAG: DUF4082 domain-containing protein [Methylococcaceae bacterium]|nr:DUF4082 domain-containing protein [Methylococcaceae bacterium]
MNKRSIHSILIGIVIYFFSMSVQAAAVYDFDSAPIRFGEANVTVGFKFTANKNLTVNALGFYDDSQNGLTTSHDVGIYDLNGTLLTATSIASGTGASLDGKFRYSGISSFNLISGQSYIIAGLATGEDGYTYGNVGSTIQGLTVDPAIGISPLASLFLYAPTFTFPTEHFGYDLYPMVNFKFNPTSQVPIPAAFPLLGIGLAIIGGLQRRFSKKRLVS